MIHTFFKTHYWLQLGIIFFISIVVYLPALTSGFVNDDRAFIENWNSVHSLNSLPALLQGETPPGHEGTYRPIRGVLYAISYTFYHTNPLYYHIQALAMHLVATALVFSIILITTKQYSLAFFTSLLFGIHPIHVEAISFVAASFEMVGAIFLLSACALYLLATKKKTLHTGWFGLSLFFAVLAYFTYEMTLILPLLLFAFDFFLLKRFSSRTMLYYGGYVAGVVGYLIIRLLLHIPAKNPISLTVPSLQQLPPLFTEYLSALVFPPISTNTLPAAAGSLLFHTLSIVNPAPASPSLLSTFLFSLTALTLFIAPFVLRKKHPRVAFGFAWFGICLIPVLVISLQSLPLAAKYTYLASLGICLVVSLGICATLQMKTKTFLHVYLKSFFLLSFSLFIIMYMGITYWNNTLWGNDMEMFMKKIQSQPDSAMKYNDLGVIYATQGNLPKAIQSFNHAISLQPNYYQARYNIKKLYEYQTKKQSGKPTP